MSGHEQFEFRSMGLSEFSVPSVLKPLAVFPKLRFKDNHRERYIPGMGDRDGDVFDSEAACNFA